MTIHVGRNGRQAIAKRAAGKLRRLDRRWQANRPHLPPAPPDVYDRRQRALEAADRFTPDEEAARLHDQLDAWENDR